MHRSFLPNWLFVAGLLSITWNFAGMRALQAEEAVPASTEDAPVETTQLEPGNAQTDRLRMNQLQVIGSHNSFKTAIDPALYKLMAAVKPETRQLDYAHPSLTDQLNLGLRGLEIDLYNDPEGGHYARPLGQSLVQATGQTPLDYDPQGKMNEPGFKVLHVHDIDFRSSCFTLDEALTEMSRWSQRHPRHLPVVITFNLSDSKIELPGSVTPVPFDQAAYDRLDKALRHGFGKQRLLEPDEVRGGSDTLAEAIRTKGWPTLAQARGKFVLVLDDAGAKREAYLANHRALRGRAMFVNSAAGRPEAAIMIRNNPLAGGDEITKLVEQGYLVRTRADANTKEARTGDYARFEAAKRSGAQVITTDYYLRDWRLNAQYRVRFERGDCIRLNPVTTQTH